MTASEFAFLVLGLVLGVAVGAALVVVLRSRPPSHEVRLTVSHDAVPKRSSTLSSDAFVTVPPEPARGGPADRRMIDRDAPAEDPPPYHPVPSPSPAGMPVMRTDVPSAPRGPFRVTPAPPLSSAPSAMASEVRVAVAVADPVTTLERVPLPHPITSTDLEPALEGAATPALVRMLHGDHRTMLTVVDLLAGPDGAARRAWQIELTALVEATIARTVDLGVLHFPMGNPFWDSFTVDQCREIAGALAARGHRFDGLGGWELDHAPGYRELTQAVADTGIDPRRVRAWPNSSEIASLYRGARVAAEDLLERCAPDLDAGDVLQVLGARAESFPGVWGAWDRLRPLLLSTAVGASA